jgi:hypothetical protein
MRKVRKIKCYVAMAIFYLFLFILFFELFGRGGHHNGSPQKREGHAVRQPINPA